MFLNISMTIVETFFLLENHNINEIIYVP
jgi:hypothetical protein